MSESKHHDHDHGDHEDHGHHDHDHNEHEHDHLIVALLRRAIELIEEGNRLQKEDLRLQKEDLQLSRDILALQVETLRQLHRLLYPRSTQLKVAFGDNMAATDPGKVAVGAAIVGTPIAYQQDGVTPSGGVVSNPDWSVPDGSIVSTQKNDNGTATFTGVAAGTVQGVVSGTVTDTDGVISQLNGNFTITVTEVTPPGSRSTQLQVSFSPA